MTAILGRKIGMTQSFDQNGKQVPVSIIQAGPCKVLATKSEQDDGYNAGVLGFEQTEGSKVKNKALLGYFKKLGTPVYRVIKEFRDLTAEVGSEISVSDFQAGDRLTVVGVSRGKGWASGIKRWNFSRGRETHGGNYNRSIGSCGMKEYPGRVLKGKKMSGRMGTDQKTVKNILVVDVIAEDNLLIVKGPIVGGENGLLYIQKMAKPKAKKAA